MVMLLFSFETRLMSLRDRVMPGCWEGMCRILRRIGMQLCMLRLMMVVGALETVVSCER